jgi:hypothetical protein
MMIERLKSGVVTVGHGRGFVVEGTGERLVITAAHCLPSLPPALPSFGLEVRTYGPLLARRANLSSTPAQESSSAFSSWLIARPRSRYFMTQLRGSQECD